MFPGDRAVCTCQCIFSSIPCTRANTRKMMSTMCYIDACVRFLYNEALLPQARNLEEDLSF